jgi:Asp/Glu/hydantoin racemase
VIANALAAERDGYDAFVIGHFQEPGLSEARAAVSIPVIGLGEATMLHACTLGRRIGLVTINPVFVPYHEDQIARHGLQQRVIAVTTLTAEVALFNTAFDDERAYARLCESFTMQAGPLLDRGVEVIIPAGGYPMLLFGRQHGFTIGGATVLNGLPIAVAAAETAIRLRRLNGTCTSRRSSYALPPGEAVEEFGRAFALRPPASEAAPSG